MRYARSAWRDSYRQRVILQCISRVRRDLGMSSVVKHSKPRREWGHDAWMRLDRTPIHVVGTAGRIARKLTLSTCIKNIFVLFDCKMESGLERVMMTV